MIVVMTTLTTVIMMLRMMNVCEGKVRKTLVFYKSH